MRYVELLDALGLGSKLNLNDAEKTGSCSVVLSDSLELTIEQDSERDIVNLYAPLTPLRGADRASLSAILLQTHLLGVATDGAYFGFDAMQEKINLFKAIPLTDTDPAAAAKEVESFANYAQALMQALPGMSSGIGSKAVSSPGGMSSSAPPFMPDIA